MNSVNRFFKMLMKRISKLCNNNEMCVFLLIALMGFGLHSLLEVAQEGLNSGPFPGAFQVENVTKDSTGVVGQVPIPNRAKASSSLQAEVAALPDPNINNFIRQSSTMDKQGSISLIQNAPLVEASREGDQERFIRWNSVAVTPPTGGDISGAVGNGSNKVSNE